MPVILLNKKKIDVEKNDVYTRKIRGNARLAHIVVLSMDYDISYSWPPSASTPFVKIRSFDINKCCSVGPASYVYLDDFEKRYQFIGVLVTDLKVGDLLQWVSDKDSRRFLNIVVTGVVFKDTPWEHQVISYQAWDVEKNSLSSYRQHRQFTLKEDFHQKWKVLGNINNKSITTKNKLNK